MRQAMKKTALALMTAAVLVLSSCGGDSTDTSADDTTSESTSESPSEKPAPEETESEETAPESGPDDEVVAENLAQGLLDEGAQESLAFSPEEADCIGQEMVAGVGVDQLQEYGIVKEDLSFNKDPDDVKMTTGDAEATADAILGCADLRGMFQEQMAQQLQGQPPAVAKCIDEALTDEVLRDLFVATFTGKAEQAQQELLQPFIACAQEAGGVPPS
jgi:hypothetical protein